MKNPNLNEQYFKPARKKLFDEFTFLGYTNHFCLISTDDWYYSEKTFSFSSINYESSLTVIHKFRKQITGRRRERDRQTERERRKRKKIEWLI